MRMVLWPGSAAVKASAAEVFDYRSNDKISVGAIKFFADGSIQGYTGHLREPYFGHPHGSTHQADERGYSTLTESDKALLVDLVKQGRQVAVHANGDAAIDEVLELLTPLAETIREQDLRPIVIHAQMTRPEHITKMVALGVTPSYFPSHVYVWGDRHRDLFIGERATTISPLQSSLDAGLRFTIHQDSPVVPLAPMRVVQTAAERRTFGGRLLGASERVSVEQALRATTIDAAWQMHLEHDRGSLSAGKLADFVVLDANPLTVPVASISDIEVLQTWIGGVKRFQRD